jgi:Fic family protein
MKYIYQSKVWPNFIWEVETISLLLGAIRNKQGRLLGQMEELGFDFRREALLKTLTEDIVKSSEIEGEILNQDKVRSSVARKLGLNIGGLIPSDRHIDGIVEMMIDATSNYMKPLTKNRLYGWHACLVPTGRSGMQKIKVGAWREDKHGPMTVVSGSQGRQKIHFEAPEASCLNREMTNFIKWFNAASKIDPVLKSAIAHLWFVTLHPFDDGNGRIARAIGEMQLARSDGSADRFYSMSVQIRKERKNYYTLLERTQKNQHVSENGIDITPWLDWFLSCLSRALITTESTLQDVLLKARFWKKYSSKIINNRQRMMVNKLFDGFEGKLTSSKWAKIAKCSQDTAIRDIQDLIKKGVLLKNEGGGRSTSYSLIINDN